MSDSENKLPAVLAEPAPPQGGWDDPLFKDDDLEEIDLSKLRPRPTAKRMVLMGLVVLFAGWLIHGYWDEISYFFQSDEPVDLGNAMDYVLVLDGGGSARRGKALDFPHNAFVRVRGLPVHQAVASNEASRFSFRITAQDQTVIYQLEGAKIFVQEDVAHSHLKSMGTVTDSASEERTIVEVLDLKGRLKSFAHDDANIYAGLRAYYAARYGMHFCSDMQPAEIERGRSELGRGGMVLSTTDPTAGFVDGASGTNASLTAVDFPGRAGKGFAVGSAGTLLTSEDAGATWSTLGLEDDPSLLDVAFTRDLKRGVLTGKRGVLLHSDDGGETFSSPYPYVEQDIRSVTWLDDGTHAVAVGGEGLLLRSDDGGRTWSPRPILTEPTIHDVELLASGTLLAAGEGGTLLRSTNQGQTWAPMVTNTSATLYDVVPLPNGRVLVGGSRATVLVSDDDGARWRSADVQVVAGLPFSYALHGAAAHADGQHVVFVGTDGALARSQDGGVTVEPRSHSHATGVVAEQMLERNLPTALALVQQSAALPTLESVAWAGDVAFAVGREATLLESVDFGKTWRRRPLPLEKDTSLYDVLFVSPTRGFIVGNKGLVLTTRNGGKTWERMDSKTKRSIRRLTLLQQSPAIVLIAGKEGLWGFWRESDDTWYRRSPDSELNYLGVAPRVPFDGDINNVQLVLVGDDATFQLYDDRSESSSTAWRVAPGSLLDVAVARDAIPAGPTQASEQHVALAVGRSGAIFRSANGGLSFSGEPSGTRADLRAVTVSRDGSLAFVGGDDGTLLVDHDAAQAWERLALASTDSVAGLVLVEADNQQTLFVAAGAAVWRSDDRGATFTHVVDAPGTLTAMALDASGRIVAVGVGGSILLSRDTGASWIAVESPVHDDLQAVSVTGERIVAVGDKGKVVRSFDGGSSWEAGTTGADVDLLGVMSPESGPTWAFGRGGAFLRSDDQGRSWERLPPATRVDWHHATMTPDGQIWVVGDDQTVMHSADGKHWSPRSSILSGLYAVEFLADGVVGVAVGDDGAILRTEDGGETWSMRSSRTSTTLHDVAFAPNGRDGVVVGDRTLLRTKNGGESWRKLKLELNANLYAAAIVPAGEQATVFIAGEEGAAYVAESTDLERFSLVPVPFREDIRDLTVADQSGRLVAVGGQYEDPGKVCEPGYVLTPDETPGSHWRYLLMAILVGGFALFTGINLARHLVYLVRQ